MLSGDAAAARVKLGLDSDRDLVAFPRPLLWLIRSSGAWALAHRLDRSLRFETLRPK